jgi:hypothetical protein
MPPVTSTSPFASSVAWWRYLAVLIEPAGDQVFDAGLKSSTLATLEYPPATRISPVRSKVAVGLKRGVAIDGAADQASPAGS